jgi:heparanase 1
MRALLALFLLIVACGPRDPEVDGQVALELDGDQAVATIDERFLSVAVDSSQLVGLEFWNPDATSDTEWVPVEAYDFGREQLRTLAAALAPAWLRIGGTQADVVWYDMHDEPDTEPPEGAEGVLTQAEMEGLCSFAEELGFTMMFTLNAGPSVRGEDGAWLSDNSAELIDWVVQTGCPIEVWELANEPNAFILHYPEGYEPEQYAADMATLASLRDEHHPSSRIAGPCVAWWPEAGEFLPFTEEALAAGGEHFDVVTWHYYPQQSERCPMATVPATPEAMQEPENLDEVLVWAAEVEAATQAHTAGAEVWLGETGNAQCGGQPGVSDRFASSFWWLDQLGLMAARGQQMVARQTLSGADYGIIDDWDETPRPDYWASLLWRRLMGTTVLAVSSPDPTVRAYAHCHPDGGGDVTVLGLNLDPARELWLPLDAPEGLETWIVTAEGLEASAVQLNGATLALEGGAVPDTPGVEADHFVLPPRSYGFARLRGVGAGACR